MKELNIGRILTEHRRRRGVTQEELAEFIGVSKASVSKWETSTTYPDITLLPRLAAFFHISIDELMGYEPQMAKQEIRMLYRQLAQDFSVNPFDEVFERCREIARKYFACPPLLFQIGCLYTNHYAQAGTPEKVTSVLVEAAELFRRTQQESDDVSLKNQALQMQAFCLLQLGRGTEVLELLDASVPIRMAPEPLLASAFQQTGQPLQAGRVLQAGIYQTILELMNLMCSYLPLCRKDPDALEETCRRITALADIFQLKTLHPSILLSVYLAIAQEWTLCGKQEMALHVLEQYGELAVSGIFPLRLHGDSYFTLLDSWFEENLPLGSDLPRNEAAVLKSFAEALTQNPAFASLAREKRFQTILSRLCIQEDSQKREKEIPQ